MTFNRLHCISRIQLRLHSSIPLSATLNSLEKKTIDQNNTPSLFAIYILQYVYAPFDYLDDSYSTVQCSLMPLFASTELTISRPEDPLPKPFLPSTVQVPSFSHASHHVFMTCVRTISHYPYYLAKRSPNWPASCLFGSTRPLTTIR
jgi:hypothetical protein